jgi:hypothetical protein
MSRLPSLSKFLGYLLAFLETRTDLNLRDLFEIIFNQPGGKSCEGAVFAQPNQFQ